MKKKFRDNAKYPIIAWDFDDTININGGTTYPQCGEVRPFAKEVINLLHEIGVKNVIWTSRDVAYNQDEKKMYDDISPMIEFLDNNGIKYDAINKSIQFAPFHYNGRKVYAHLYVDDRAYGWSSHDDQYIMLNVLSYILISIIGFECDVITYVDEIEIKIIHGEEINNDIITELKQCVDRWKD